MFTKANAKAKKSANNAVERHTWKGGTLTAESKTISLSQQQEKRKEDTAKSKDVELYDSHNLLAICQKELTPLEEFTESLEMSALSANHNGMLIACVDKANDLLLMANTEGKIHTKSFCKKPLFVTAMVQDGGRLLILSGRSIMQVVKETGMMVETAFNMDLPGDPLSMCLYEDKGYTTAVISSKSCDLQKSATLTFVPVYMHGN